MMCAPPRRRISKRQPNKLKQPQTFFFFPGRLKRGLDNRVSAQFATMQMAGVDAGESKIFATLGAATNLLVDLEAVESEVRRRAVKRGGGGFGGEHCSGGRGVHRRKTFLAAAREGGAAGFVRSFQAKGGQGSVVAPTFAVETLKFV